MLSFVTAAPSDVAELVGLHAAVAEHVGRIDGARRWRVPSERDVVHAMRTTEIVLARRASWYPEGCDEGSTVATFRLDAHRGFCGVARFTEVERFVYLLDMAVHPSRMRDGVGRACLAEAERRACAAGACAIRLDTNDDELRAAAFYAACGYREVLHFAETRYFERLLSSAP